MTEPDQAVIARLSSDLAAMTAYLARASEDLHRLEYLTAQRAAAATAPPPANDRHPVVEAAASTRRPPPAPRSDGWIGKALAVAGVAVTLVGVVLLLVLAAQAGILRPGFRVFAGAALAAGLVGAGWRLSGRPGGRVGAIALTATGVAAAYIDVIAVTTIYRWITAPVGLLIAAVVAGTGLMLARRWNAERLGLLVLVPLIGLAPVVADGITLPLVGFMLALGAASLPIQLHRDWLGMHAARTAVTTFPLLAALTVSGAESHRSPVLAVASLLAAVLAVGGAVLLLRYTRNVTAMAVLSAVGTAPVLGASLAVDGLAAALMAVALSAVSLGIVVAGDRLPGITASVRIVFSALAAVAGLVAVTLAFDGPVAAPVLLALAVVVAAARSRWCALFGGVGMLVHLGSAPLTTLSHGTTASPPVVASVLVASGLLVALAVTIGWRWNTGLSWATAAVIALYGATRFAVTAGVVIGGTEHGFRAGHVAATICWVAMAAGALRYAVRVPKAQRSLPVGGGMALVAAAVAKLFSFDLGTLDGILRVAVFIVVGLTLLGMGAGYARLLGQRDDCDLRA